jgi:hypothetical protein
MPSQRVWYCCKTLCSGSSQHFRLHILFDRHFCKTFSYIHLLNPSKALSHLTDKKTEAERFAQFPKSIQQWRKSWDTNTRSQNQVCALNHYALLLCGYIQLKLKPWFPCKSVITQVIEGHVILVCNATILALYQVHHSKIDATILILPSSSHTNNGSYFEIYSVLFTHLNMQ